MREEQLFLDVVELPFESRASYLASVCGDDDTLRERVESLLRANDRADGFLDPLVPPPSTVISKNNHLLATTNDFIHVLSASNEDFAGRCIGRYRLTGVLGEGGMGTVYAAEQFEPVHRAVAVKVIRPGMDSASILNRFEAERQALALMDHPNIARILDGGVTDEQRPYFVMERVIGRPLTEYCDTHRLSTAARLELFEIVCAAVQHAHQKGIIHRDLKPSNILVETRDGKPCPKVIDFGIAKALRGSLTDHSIHTEAGFVIGTREYMSPEMADPSSADIDTRSDVYSLGVILYELLTGRTPFEPARLRQTSMLECLRIIREEEPPAPSSRLKNADTLVDIAERRDTEPERLIRQVRGELDWIVTKALEKDRTRRYESPSALAEDLRRHLANEPILAGPVTRIYRLGKFVRRNRPMVIAGCMVLGALVTGTTAATVGLVEAVSARKLSDQRFADLRIEKAKVEAAKTDAENAEARAVRDRDLAVGAEADSNAFNTFVIDSILTASLPEKEREGLGKSITLAEAISKAEPNLEAAFVNRPVAEARARRTIARTWNKLGRYPEAEVQYLRAIELQQQHLGADAPDTLDTLIGRLLLLLDMSRYAEARQLGEELVPRVIAVFGPDHEGSLQTRIHLSQVYLNLGDMAKALPMVRELHEHCTRVLGPEHTKTLSTLNSLGLGLASTKRWVEAQAVFEKLVSLRSSVSGPDHPLTITALSNLGHSLHSNGQRAAALAIYLDAKGRALAVLGDKHKTTLTVCDNLSILYLELGRKKDALELCEWTLERQRTVLGNDHRSTLSSLSNLARIYKANERFTDAIPLQLEVLEGNKSKYPKGHPAILAALYNLGHTYHLAGRPADVLPPLEEATTQYKATVGMNDPVAASAAVLLGRTYITLKRDNDAEPWLRAALPYFDTPAKLRSFDGVALVRSLTAILMRNDNPAEAEPLLRAALQAVGQTNATFNTVLRSDLGGCLTALSRFEEAEPHLLAAASGLKPGAVEVNRVLDATSKRLVELYEKWDMPQKAAEWRAKTKPGKQDVK